MLRNPGLRKSVEQPVLDLNFAASQIGSNAAPDSRIDFSRGSNAWFVDSDGLVKKSPHNLITNSGHVLARFSHQNSTETFNTTVSPDGTFNGDLLVPDTSNASHTSFISTLSISASTSYAYSMFVKANGYDFVQLTFTGGFGNNNVWANFNLSTGATASKGSAATCSIEDYGDGWFRCVVIGTTGASATTGGPAFAAIGSDTASRDPSFAGDGTSGIFVWGAQLSQHYVLPVDNPYIATSSSSVVYAARLDHDPSWFMSAAQEQNLLEYSEMLDDSYWTKVRSSVTANAIAAPDGTTTAELMKEDSSSSTTHLIRQTTDVQITDGTTYAYSGYVKAKERTKLRIRFTDAAIREADIDLSAGTITDVTAGGLAKFTSVALTDEGDGWFRFVGIRTANETGVVSISIHLLDDAGNITYTGDGSSGLYVWGLQLEVGSTAGTYHRTTGQPYYGEGATPKGLLIEEQRTNLINRSETIGGTGWTNRVSGTATGTYTLNHALAPNGTVTATKANFSRDNATQYVFTEQLITLSATGLTQGSCYIKAASSSDVGKEVHFWQFHSGVGIVNQSIATLTSEWQRFEFVNTYSHGGSISEPFSVGLINNVGSELNVSVLLWGAQLEAGSFATSYIQTTGTTLTRNADVATMGPTTGGTELVTNGTFDTDTTGWTEGQTSGVTATVSSGVVTASASTASGAGIFYQSAANTPTVIGRRYRATAELSVVSGSGTSLVIYSSFFSGQLGSSSITSGSNQTVTVDFTATTTATHVAIFRVAPFATNDVYKIDNVSVRELYPFEQYNPAEMTIVSEHDMGSGVIWSAVDDANSSFNDNIYFTSSNFVIRNGGTLTGSVFRSDTTAGKLAAAFKENDAQFAADGAAGTADTSTAIPATDKFSIGTGSWSGSTNFIDGTIKRLTFYNRRLPDETLEALTDD